MFPWGESTLPLLMSNALTDEQWTALHDAGWPHHVGDGIGLWVSVRDQRLVLIDGRFVVGCWPVSTARAGLGQREGSGCTPTGWHEIADRIGADLPEGAVLRGRVWTGQVWRDGEGATDADADLVLTRVLWLRGLEPGRNAGDGVDTHRRYIYIHGTNRPDLLGRPVSHGCIRMANAAVIELFDRVAVSTRILIGTGSRAIP